MSKEILCYKKRGDGKKSPGGKYDNGKRDKVVGGGRPENKPTRPSKTR